MIQRNDTHRVTRRLTVAGLLALLGIGLSLADRVVPGGRGTDVNEFATAHAGSGPINATVDTLLRRYGIDLRTITTWRMLTPDRKLLRVEQRVFVPHDFPSVELNYELNQQLLPLGARIAATERSRENVVTMHVVNRGVIIRSISFALRPREVEGKADQGKGGASSRVH